MKYPLVYFYIGNISYLCVFNYYNKVSTPLSTYLPRDTSFNLITSTEAKAVMALQVFK